MDWASSLEDPAIRKLALEDVWYAELTVLNAPVGTKGKYCMNGLVTHNAAFLTKPLVMIFTLEKEEEGEAGRMNHKATYQKHIHFSIEKIWYFGAI